MPDARQWALFRQSGQSDSRYALLNSGDAGGKSDSPAREEIRLVFLRLQDGETPRVTLFLAFKLGRIRDFLLKLTPLCG